MASEAKRNGYKLVNSALCSANPKTLLNTLGEMVRVRQDLSNHIYFFDTLKKFNDVMKKFSSNQFLTLMRTLTVQGATVILLGHTNKHPDANGHAIFEGVGDIRNDVDELSYIQSFASADGATIKFSIVPDKHRSYVRKASFSYDRATRELTPLSQEYDLTADVHKNNALVKDKAIIDEIILLLKIEDATVTSLVEHVSQRIGIGTKRVRDCIDRWGPTGLMPDAPHWITRREVLHNKLVVSLTK